MKIETKLVAIIIALVLFINFYTSSIINAYAHEAMLDVKYDNCGVEEDESNPGKALSRGDGIDEMWYVLSKDSVCRHYSHETSIIKYYFAESSPDGYKWTDYLSESEAENVKNAYANSMKKWNNVYFYSYNSYGSVIKNKVINLVEGSESDYNIIIYPGYSTDAVADVNSILGSDTPIETGETKHIHYTKWKMNVYVNHFYNSANIVRERTGAHELGHVLGLRDIDSNNLCHTTLEGEHHNELLMGYSSPRALDISYKDIAGVAITRGFHTDDDHKWLNSGIQEDGTYKLICSICNGVKCVESLSGISYSTYGYCNNNHDLSDGNMMAVASYGNYDYYKCKYCRYVAPFSDLVPQNYVKTYSFEDLHRCDNRVNGLEYTFFEPHNVIGNICIGCGAHFHLYTHHYQQYTAYAHKAFCECGEYILEDHRHLAPSYDCVFCGAEHEHTYETSYEWISDKSHTAYCVCGESKIEGHVVSQNALPLLGGRKVCLLCGGLASVGNVQLDSTNRLPYTENGSYITSDGITVLVDEDIEAFLNGTLEFIFPSVGETL